MAATVDLRKRQNNYDNLFIDWKNPPELTREQTHQARLTMAELSRGDREGLRVALEALGIGSNA